MKKLFATLFVFTTILCSAQTSTERVRNSVSYMSVWPESNRGYISIYEEHMPNQKPRVNRYVRWGFPDNQDYKSLFHAAVARSYSSHKRNQYGGVDYNDIQTTAVNVKSGYLTESDVNSLKIGHEIMSYWFGYKSDAQKELRTDIITGRGEWAASDQDVLNAQASQIGYAAIQDKGYKLIANSYLEIATYDSMAVKVVRTRTVDYNGKTKETIDTTYTVYFTEDLYKIVYDDALEDQVFSAWTDMQAFKNITCNMRHVGRIHTSSSVTSRPGAKGSFAKAMSSVACGYYIAAETEHENANVDIAITKNHPIHAKIGAKEGLTDADNASRYKIFKYVEDKKGTLKKKKVGFARLTKVGQNQMASTGKTDLKYQSQFYQISGLTAQPGYTLLPSSDLKSTISVVGGLGALYKGAIEYDNLVHAHTWGGFHYVTAGLGFDTSNTTAGSNKLFFFNIGIGYGFGIHLTRVFELRPFVRLGADGIIGASDQWKKDNGYVKKDGKALNGIGYTITGGADLSIMIAYPVFLFARCEYGVSFLGDAFYRDVIEFEKTVSRTPAFSHGKSLGLKAGIRVNF